MVYPQSAESKLYDSETNKRHAQSRCEVKLSLNMQVIVLVAVLFGMMYHDQKKQDVSGRDIKINITTHKNQPVIVCN